jgi:hypothetical protein
VTQRSPLVHYSLFIGRGRVTPLKEALTALADVLAKRPAEEILFDWFRSGRLVGELSVLIKRTGKARLSLGNQLPRQRR